MNKKDSEKKDEMFKINKEFYGKIKKTGVFPKGSYLQNTMQLKNTLIRINIDNIEVLLPENLVNRLFVKE